MSMLQFCDICLTLTEASQLEPDTLLRLKDGQVTTARTYRDKLHDIATDLWATCPDRLRVLGIVALLEQKSLTDVELYTIEEIASTIYEHFSF